MKTKSFVLDFFITLSLSQISEIQNPKEERFILAYRVQCFNPYGMLAQLRLLWA